MEKKLKYLIGIIAISVLLNFWSIGKIGRLENQIDSIRNSVGQWAHLNSEINSLYGRMARLEEEKRWINRIEFIPNVEDSTLEEIHMYIQWSLREFEINSIPKLRYKKSYTDDTWIEILAEKKEEGTFLAPVILDPTENYQFQVVMEGSFFVAGEVMNIPSYYYKPPRLQGTYTQMEGTGKATKFTTEMVLAESPMFDFYKVDSVRVVTYKDGKEYNSRYYKAQSNGTEVVVDYTVTDDISFIILEVSYGSGLIEKFVLHPYESLHYPVELEEKDGQWRIIDERKGGYGY